MKMKYTNFIKDNIKMIKCFYCKFETNKLAKLERHFQNKNKCYNIKK